MQSFCEFQFIKNVGGVGHTDDVCFILDQLA